jgi:ABC-type branched-subunit amino acid transport system ATPase component
LTIHVNDRDDEETVIIDYDYHKDLYYDKEIEFIHQHLLSLLWHALDNPGKRIYTIEMLPESEKRKVLYEFNNTEADYPKDKTIHQLFEQQVTKTPDNTALICEDKSITYRQLNERANSLAVLLREKGIKPGDVIAIMVRRSIEMVIGMLAVLKAGAAFLPIDKELPDERINYMIKNSESKVILTDNTTIYRFTEYDKINIQCEEHYNFKKEDLANINNVRDLAYVLYTSGTTGEPKGVMIEHTSLVNFVYAVTKFMDFSSDSIVLSYTSFCFDIFIFEIFTSLLTGAKIILANETEQKIPRYTCSLINKHRVNKILTTPSKIKLFLTENENIKMLESIREIMVGGEVFPPELLKLLKNNLNAKIINGYGPTETTTLRTISGLKKPTSGTIFFNGNDITSASAQDRVRMGISLSPEGRRIFSSLTVLENLELGAYLRRDKAEIKKDISIVYERFPILKDRRKQAAGTLSGGEQQMLAIGRALMSRPKLLCLDEPSMGLAPLLVQEIFDIIRDINQKGTTILLVEQNASMALQIANRAYVMETGTIPLSGTGADLMRSEDIKKAYLGG